MPKFYGALERLLGFALGGWHGRRRGFAVVLEDKRFGLAFRENEFGGDAAKIVRLERGIGGQAEVGIVRQEVGAAVDELQLMGYASVVEGGPAPSEEAD